MNKLSRLIYLDLTTLGDEQTHPGPDSDDSDRQIEDCKARISALRGMREELEESMTGGLLD